MKIVADRRSRTVDPSPDRVRNARRTAATYRDVRLDMAKALAALQQGGDHLLLGYGSLRDYAVQVLLIPGSEVRNLLDLGLSLGLLAAPDEASCEGSGAGDADSPVAGQADGGARLDDATPRLPVATIEDRVRDGVLPTDNAAQLARLRRELGGLSPDEQARWSRLAESTRSWKFRGLVSAAIESARQGRPTHRFEAYVTESAMEDFRRAKVIGSQRAQRRLTDGQVLALIARRFVETEDPRFVGEKKRRVGDTKRSPGRRFVPASVQRAIFERSKRCCEVGDCSNDVFLELMHIRTPHSQGGGREVEDLAEGCTNHHVLLDAGVIRFVGFDEWQRPLFRARDGRLIARSPPSRAHGSLGPTPGPDPPEP